MILSYEKVKFRCHLWFERTLKLIIELFFLIWCLWFVLTAKLVWWSVFLIKILRTVLRISERYPDWKKNLKVKIMRTNMVIPGYNLYHITHIKSMIHDHAAWRTINIARWQSLDFLVKTIPMITWIFLHVSHLSPSAAAMPLAMLMNKFPYYNDCLSGSIISYVESK